MKTFQAGANSATTKFNFLAWAFERKSNCKPSATDLMVLSQLLVRCDPNASLSMAVSTLASCIGAGESSVRQSISRLTKWNYIKVTRRTRQSNLYEVNYAIAPQKWMSIKRNQRKQASGSSPPNMLGSQQGSATILEGTPPGSPAAPFQDSGDISISSKYYNSHSSFMRPSGQEETFAIAEEEKNSVEDLAQYSNQIPPRQRRRAGPAPGGRQIANGAPDEDYELFVATWPKKDRDPGMLRGAWINNVIKAGVDPEDVIDAAQRVAEHHRDHPQDPVQPAGKWLANKGWQPHRLPTQRAWGESAEDYAALVKAAAASPKGYGHECADPYDGLDFPHEDEDDGISDDDY